MAIETDRNHYEISIAHWLEQGLDETKHRWVSCPWGTADNWRNWSWSFGSQANMKPFEHLLGRFSILCILSFFIILHHSSMFLRSLSFHIISHISGLAASSFRRDGKVPPAGREGRGPVHHPRERQLDRPVATPELANPEGPRNDCGNGSGVSHTSHWISLNLIESHWISLNLISQSHQSHQSQSPSLSPLRFVYDPVGRCLGAGDVLQVSSSLLDFFRSRRMDLCHESTKGSDLSSTGLLLNLLSTTSLKLVANRSVCWGLDLGHYLRGFRTQSQASRYLFLVPSIHLLCILDSNLAFLLMHVTNYTRVDLYFLGPRSHLSLCVNCGGPKEDSIRPGETSCQTRNLKQLVLIILDHFRSSFRSLFWVSIFESSSCIFPFRKSSLDSVCWQARFEGPKICELFQCGHQTSLHKISYDKLIKFNIREPTEPYYFKHGNKMVSMISWPICQAAEGSASWQLGEVHGRTQRKPIECQY